MRQAEVKVGGVYEVKWHDGRLTHVRVTGTRRHPVQSGYYPWRTVGFKVRYSAVNLATGRPVVVKSAAKFRREVVSDYSTLYNREV